VSAAKILAQLESAEPAILARFSNPDDNRPEPTKKIFLKSELAARDSCIELSNELGKSAAAPDS